MYLMKVLPESMACRLYVITVLVQTTIDLAIEGDLLVRFHKDGVAASNTDTLDKMPAYLSIFALAQWVVYIHLDIHSVFMSS